MTAIDIPKALRAEDKFHHIDMGFLNRRLCVTAITAFHPEALQHFREHQKPGHDHMTGLANDHLLVTTLLDCCEALAAPTLLEALALGRPLTWSRWFGQLEGLVKVYSDCEITPSSSSAPALTGGCHGWHEAGSYPVIDDDDDALWNCGNLAAGAQAWAAALAREISNGLWAPASPPSGFSATVSGRPQAGQVHSAGWDMVLGPLMR